MDENKNRFNRDNEPAPDREWNNDSNNNPSPEPGSSYYYSYGPFKSFNKDEAGNDNNSVEHYNRREPERVEITPPEPVKPLPYSPTIRSTGYDGNGGNRGGNGGNGECGGNGWQYYRKPKSSLKTVMVSFLAGMIVLSGSMYMADRGNWFTPDTASTFSGSGTNTSAKAPSESAGSKPATTTASLITGKGDVSSVVDHVGPAVVKIYFD
jgi:serine protease Do